MVLLWHPKQQNFYKKQQTIGIPLTNVVFCGTILHWRLIGNLMAHRCCQEKINKGNYWQMRSVLHNAHENSDYWQEWASRLGVATQHGVMW
jgi:hypothetical protein